MTAGGGSRREQEPLLRIEVLFWGKSGEAAMTKTIVTLPQGTTIDGLLRHMDSLWGLEVSGEVIEKGSMFLAINGLYWDMRRKPGRVLKSDDVVAILPVVAGG